MGSSSKHNVDWAGIFSTLLLPKFGEELPISTLQTLHRVSRECRASTNLNLVRQLLFFNLLGSTTTTEAISYLDKYGCLFRSVVFDLNTVGPKNKSFEDADLVLNLLSKNMSKLERITIKGSAQSSNPSSVLWILRALNFLVSNLKYLGRLLTVELLGISSLEVTRLVVDTDIISELRNTIVSCSSLVHIDLPFLFSELEGLSRERFYSLTGLGVILDRASYALVQSEIHDSNIRHLTLDSSIVQTFQPGLFIEAGIKSKIKSLRLLGDGFMFIDVADARPSDAFENLESVDINLPLFSFIPYSLLSSCSRLVVLKLQNCTDFNDSLFSIVLDTHYTLKEIALSSTAVTPLCLKFFNFSSASISHVLLHFSPSVVEPDFYYPIVEAAHLTHLDIKIRCEHLKSLAPLLLHSPSLEVVKIHGIYADQASKNEDPSALSPLDTLSLLTSQIVSCKSRILRNLCLKLSFENEDAKHRCPWSTYELPSDRVDNEITQLLEAFPCLLSLHLYILTLWDSDECFKPFVDTNRFPWALVQVK